MANTHHPHTLTHWCVWQQSPKWQQQQHTNTFQFRHLKLLLRPSERKWRGVKSSPFTASSLQATQCPVTYSHTQKLKASNGFFLLHFFFICGFIFVALLPLLFVVCCLLVPFNYLCLLLLLRPHILARCYCYSYCYYIAFYFTFMRQTALHCTALAGTNYTTMQLEWGLDVGECPKRTTVCIVNAATDPERAPIVINGSSAQQDTSGRRITIFIAFSKCTPEIGKRMPSSSCCSKT